MTRASRPSIDGRALLRWILLELPEPPWADGAPFVGMVYLDAAAGLAAKGWSAAAPLAGELVVRMPIGVPGRVLTDDEVTARGLPSTPPWLAACGPQPPRDAPWRDEPGLIRRAHPRFPDDVQVLIHDGEPRRTGRRTEVCWARLDGAELGGPRPVTDQVAQTPIYRATLLSRPHQLTSIAIGDRLGLLADPGGRYPLLVTDAYLAERAAWRFTPCTGCGLHEGLDPPSVMAATRFPELAAAARPSTFTTPCPACRGTIELART